MKRLKSKKGFTLVECVVAMAVLAIMSLMLMMILEITLMTRNKNMQYERELDAAVENLADPNAAADKEELDGKLDFGDFAISGGEAYKNTYGDSELGKLDYDFDEYFQKLPKPQDISADNGEIVENGAGAVGGSYDDGVKKTPSATGATSVNINTEDSYDETGKNHVITVTVSFTSHYETPERALKVILPKEAQYMGCNTNNNCNVNSSANYSVRIRPNRNPSDYTNGGNLGTGYNEAGFKVTAVFSFRISDDNYKKYYQNPGTYFKGEKINETENKPYTYTASFSIDL